MKLAAAVLLLTPTFAWSETRLICANPLREYEVTYSPGAANIILRSTRGETLYPILVDDNQDGSHIVTADTPNDGPSARLHLRPYLKMEFWSDGQLEQTDGCYAAGI